MQVIFDNLPEWLPREILVSVTVSVVLGILGWLFRCIFRVGRPKAPKYGVSHTHALRESKVPKPATSNHEDPLEELRKGCRSVPMKAEPGRLYEFQPQKHWWTDHWWTDDEAKKREKEAIARWRREAKSKRQSVTEDNYGGGMWTHNTQAWITFDPASRSVDTWTGIVGIKSE